MPEKCTNCPIYKDGRWSLHMANGKCPFLIIFPEKCVFMETLAYHLDLDGLEGGEDEPICPECESGDVTVCIVQGKHAEVKCNTCDHEWEISHAISVH